jgi:hypothetical protein
LSVFPDIALLSNQKVVATHAAMTLFMENDLTYF